MPDSPPAIFTPPTKTPAAVGAVTTPGGTPGTPAAIATAPGARVGTHATLTNANIQWTAAVSGAAGNGITIQIVAGVAVISVGSVTGSAVTMTTATKQNMVISGTLDGNATGTLEYQGDSYGMPAWTTGGAIINSVATQVSLYGFEGVWHLRYRVDSILVYAANKESAAATPDGLTDWEITVGSGQPTITAAASTKAQTIAAANANAAVAALVTAAASGDVTGTTAGMFATALTGGGGLEPPAAITS